MTAVYIHCYSSCFGRFLYGGTVSLSFFLSLSIYIMGCMFSVCFSRIHGGTVTTKYLTSEITLAASLKATALVDKYFKTVRENSYQISITADGEHIDCIKKMRSERSWSSINPLSSSVSGRMGIWLAEMAREPCLWLGQKVLKGCWKWSNRSCFDFILITHWLHPLLSNSHIIAMKYDMYNAALKETFIY